MKWVLVFAVLSLPLGAQETSQTKEKKSWTMSTEDEKQLERDKVLITPNRYSQIDGAYLGMGGEFITSDTVIAAWNVLLGQSLEILDKCCARQLPDDLEAALTQLPVEPPGVMRREDFDAALRKARLILGVASKLEGGSWRGSEELDGLIAEEVKRIESAQGSSLPAWLTAEEAVPIRPFDYGVFKPVAAYAGDERMARHYRTVRWLQYASLAPNHPVNQITGKLLSGATGYKKSFKLLSDQAEMLFGLTEGEEKEFMRLSVIVPGKGLDTRLFEMSTSPGRPWPNPVEVMALAGMPMAEKMVSSEPAVARGIEELGQSWAWWPRALTQSYLGAMAALSDTSGDDLPAFVKSEAWQRKCLNTGLAGWAQMCHATALSRDIAGSPFGMVENPPRSFVEPNPEFFHRFGQLVSETIDGFSRCGSGLESSDEGDMVSMLRDWLRLKDLCHDLEGLAHKQLRGVELSKRDQQIFDGFGTRLGACMVRNREVQDDAPQVAVAYSRPGTGVLLVGTGRPQQILVRYPWKGQEYVCHGAVLPFRSLETDRSLTDAEWKALLDSPQAPAPPEWLKPIQAP